jgi:hypothetical protein
LAISVKKHGQSTGTQKFVLRSLHPDKKTGEMGNPGHVGIRKFDTPLHTEQIHTIPST